MFGNTYTWSYSGKLLNNEFKNLPAGNHQGRCASMIFVSATAKKEDGTTFYCGGKVLDNSSDAISIAGTVSFGLGKQQGKLTVFN